MEIQTLVAAIDQTDSALAQRMNLQTPALIGNQCGEEDQKRYRINGQTVVYLNSRDRGVGRNRNLLLDHAEGEICVLADDDMRFTDGYPQLALQAFRERPDADLLIFNLLEKNPRRYQNRKTTRVRWYNFGKYGAARIAFRRGALERTGIRFDLRFGGGAEYGSGEDTIFLRSCLKAGLRIYAVPYALAEIDQTAASTWFTGYDKKFFRDKGALYACLYPLLWPLFCTRFLLRYRKKVLRETDFPQAFAWMLAGARALKKQ